eukprot:6600333-Prymnesium_polylepis.2
MENSRPGGRVSLTAPHPPRATCHVPCIICVPPGTMSRVLYQTLSILKTWNVPCVSNVLVRVPQEVSGPFATPCLESGAFAKRTSAMVHPSVLVERYRESLSEGLKPTWLVLADTSDGHVAEGVKDGRALNGDGRDL